MQCDAVQLVFKTNQVKEAIAEYTSALEMMQQRTDNQRIKDAKDVVLKAKATKATAVILLNIISNQEAKSIRAHVQAELKELRSSGGHESELFHPCALKAANLALPMTKVGIH